MKFNVLSPLTVLIAAIISVASSEFIDISSTLVIMGFLILGCGVTLYYSTATSLIKTSLFWQLLSIAMTTPLVSHFISISYDIPRLALESMLLIHYLVLAIAIEFIPRRQEHEVTTLLSPVFAMLIFVAMLFGYFVLIPLEYSPEPAQTAISSEYFHNIVVSLLFGRLLQHAINSRFDVHAKALSFSLLAIGLSWLNCYGDHKLHAGEGEVVIPLVMVALWSLVAFYYRRFAINKKNSIAPSSPNLYAYANTNIMAMTVLLALFQGIGIVDQPAYMVSELLQSIIVVLWFICAALLISSNSFSMAKSANIFRTNSQRTSELLATKTAEIKTLEAHIINSEDTAIVSVSNNAILTVDTQGICLSANPAASQMFQCLPTQLVGMNVKSLFDEHDEMHYFFDFQSHVYSLKRNLDGISKESVALRSDQHKFPVQVAMQWAERNAEPLIVMTFFNLTERKRRERESLELKDKFIANISHEFRTPLTIINGILDRYCAQGNSGQAKEMQVAKRNGMRLVTMVEQLLELSRLRDNPQLTLHHYRLSTLMAIPVESFERLASQHNLNLSVAVDDELWIECDAQAFEKIVFNLVSNAIKYTPSGGEISIVTHREHDSVVLDVIDNGVGISDESQAKIFERFQRATDEKSATFGVGIGLSLVHELVNAHGWQVIVNSQLGAGSKFSVSMPLAEAKSQEQFVDANLLQRDLSPLFVEPQSVHAKQQAHSHKVVLVIEDNLDMQSHIKQVIEQQHHCMLAGSGEVGLELAKTYLPDLIVCDLMLTGIDGFEVLNEIKADSLTAHIPVILLTARSDLESKLKGLNLSADDYLAKPFQHNELLTRIQNLIDNRALLQQTFKRQFDEQQQEVRREDLQHSVEQEFVDTNQPSQQDKFISRLKEVVTQHHSDPMLDVNFIAKEMAMSERQLQRKVKAILGTTLSQFIREVRLYKAKAMLAQGQQISRIALDVGFSSQTYFGRCFKETFDMTPKQYQQEQLREAE